jgi:hypothetical protein
MEILGHLTGGVEKDETDIAALASTRRGIGEDDIGKVGTRFQDLDTQFQSAVKNRCCAV